MSYPTRFGFFVPEHLSQIDDALRALSPFLAGKTEQATVVPQVNVYDDGRSFLVRADLPGVDKQSLEITAQGNQLTLKGERVIHPPSEGRFIRRECVEGKFVRTVTLTEQVDSEQVSATFQNGVLEVLLPRVPERQPRKININ